MEMVTTPRPSNDSFDSGTCMEHVSGSHNSSTHYVYGGIPDNLGINFAVWVILITVFCILHKVAWDYGSLGNEEKWTCLVYGNNEGNRHIVSFESLDTQINAQNKTQMNFEIIAEGFLTWIKPFIFLKDSDILKKCGQDAIHYITFQRYLIVFVAIVTLLSTVIIIPVNSKGNFIGNASDFGLTTIANLDAESSLLWVHVLLSLVYMVLAILFMRHFLNNLKSDQDDQVSRTLMIANVPKDKCSKDLILQHFQEEYPNVVVEDVEFAYDVRKWKDMDRKRMVAIEAGMHSEQSLQKTGKRPTLRPYTCGQYLCCGCTEVDSISYYRNEAAELKEKCEKEKVTALQEPLGVAFVTFENMGMAERIKNDFHTSCKAAHNLIPSTVYNALFLVKWDVNYAPTPQNIYWEKLSQSGWKWWIKAKLLNLAVLILLFFFTTPTIFLSTLDKLHYKDFISNAFKNAVILQFLPTLLLWTSTAPLPNVVNFSNQLIGHWTKSSEHHAVMRKTFVYLLLMVLILPSLGLTSAKALFDYFIFGKEDIKWECIFLSGNGAFFVNYVITSAFIGTGLELLRLSELFTYGRKLLFAKSSAERTSVRKHVLREYQYGIQYARVLCVFATIMSYSISCPLITPFGLVYMILKHMVDRYNIFFAYAPSHISHSIHMTAINMVVVAVVFVQFNLVFFSVIRDGLDTPLSQFAIVVLILTLFVFALRVYFGCLKDYICECVMKVLGNNISDFKSHLLQRHQKASICWRVKAQHLQGWFKSLRDTHTRLHKKKSGDGAPGELTERELWIKNNFDFLNSVIRHRPEPCKSKCVASVLVKGNSRFSEAVGILSATHSLAHSYGTMDNKEPASDHVIADTGASYQQPSYTHDS